MSAVEEKQSPQRHNVPHNSHNKSGAPAKSDQNKVSPTDVQPNNRQNRGSHPWRRREERFLKDGNKNNYVQKSAMAEQQVLTNSERATMHAREGERPKNTRNRNKGNARGVKNTENLNPSHEAPKMRVVVDMAVNKMSITPQVRDVTLHPMLFYHQESLLAAATKKGTKNTSPSSSGTRFAIYKQLVKEIKNCNVYKKERLLKSWHGDSHWIADDTTGWKKECPTFCAITDKLGDYFNGMKIQATRFNWYKNDREWKPFHHDAAAVKKDKARTQNFTVAVSFGATREAAFEDTDSKTVISMPLEDASVYCFTRDVNIMWKHGILQVPPKEEGKCGRTEKAHDELSEQGHPQLVDTTADAEKKNENVEAVESSKPVAVVIKKNGKSAGATAGTKPHSDDDEDEIDTAVAGRISIIAWGWVDQDECYNTPPAKLLTGDYTA